MSLDRGELTAARLRQPEHRVVEVFRAWHAGSAARDRLWDTLCEAVGDQRARSCLLAFFDLRSLFDHHAWRMPVLLDPDAAGYSEDEVSIARFVMAATQQRREVALTEASFLVSPVALLPALDAATRFGLPLLCEECRLRVFGGPDGRRGRVS
jgi:hypothetical protein